jgi:hypothetical protein
MFESLHSAVLCGFEIPINYDLLKFDQVGCSMARFVLHGTIIVVARGRIVSGFWIIVRSSEGDYIVDYNPAGPRVENRIENSLKNGYYHGARVVRTWLTRF